jgi:hypothetical protein
LEQHCKGKLKIALDSCAGVNIGHLEFRIMADTFPELVASFKPRHEYGEREITIGGVEVSATALKLTHIIPDRDTLPIQRYSMQSHIWTERTSSGQSAIRINQLFCRKTKALWSYDDAEPKRAPNNLEHNTTYTVRTTHKAHTAPTPQDRFRAEATAVYTTTHNTDIAIKPNDNTTRHQAGWEQKKERHQNMNVQKQGKNNIKNISDVTYEMSTDTNE